MQRKTSRRFYRYKLFTANNKYLRINSIWENICILSAHLCCHKAVCDFIFLKIASDCHQVKANFFCNDMQLPSAEQYRIHIHHMRIKAIAGIRRCTAGFCYMIIINIPCTEIAKIAMFQHDAFWCAGRAGSIQQNK